MLNTIWTLLKNEQDNVKNSSSYKAVIWYVFTWRAYKREIEFISFCLISRYELEVIFTGNNPIINNRILKYSITWICFHFYTSFAQEFLLSVKFFYPKIFHFIWICQFDFLITFMCISLRKRNNSYSSFKVPVTLLSSIFIK